MIARLVIAFLLALLMVGLGISIQFTESRDEIEMDLFLEVESAVPGLRFDLGRLHSDAPFLLPLEGADPGLVRERYPGLVLGLEPEEVSEEAVFEERALLGELLPGWLPLSVRGGGHGGTTLGRSVLLWSGSLVFARDPEGVERTVLIFGLGADDLDDRFPRWLHTTRGVAIPIEAPEGTGPLAVRFSRRAVRTVGTPERFESFAERIVAEILPAE